MRGHVVFEGMQSIIGTALQNVRLVPEATGFSGGGPGDLRRSVSSFYFFFPFESPSVQLTATAEQEQEDGPRAGRRRRQSPGGRPIDGTDRSTERGSDARG